MVEPISEKTLLVFWSTADAVSTVVSSSED